MKSRAEQLAEKGIKPVRVRITSALCSGLPIGTVLEGYVDPVADHSSGAILVYPTDGGPSQGLGWTCEVIDDAPGDGVAS